MFRFMLRSLALAIFVGSAPISMPSPHCFVGGRFFPERSVSMIRASPMSSHTTVSRFKTATFPRRGRPTSRLSFETALPAPRRLFRLGLDPCQRPEDRSVRGFRNLENHVQASSSPCPASEFVMSAPWPWNGANTGAASGVPIH